MDTLDQQLLRASPQVDAKPSSKIHKVFSNRHLHQMQHRHFYLFNVAPLVATLLAIALIPFRPPSAVDLVCFISLWAFTEFCIVAGYHRLFTHRSYKAHPILRAVLQIGGLMGAQGGLVSWVAIHRRHHELSDKQGDLHSPNVFSEKYSSAWPKKLIGVLHSQFFWMYQHDYPNVMFYAADMCRDKLVNRLDKYYFYVVIGGILLPGFIACAFDPSITSFIFGVLWGGLVRIFALGNSIGAVNSLLHTVGKRRFATPDNSRNSGFFSLLTFGDSYHNNHHAFPRSASAGLEWYRIDPAYWIIRALQLVGLTRDIYVPSKERISHYQKEATHE